MLTAYRLPGMDSMLSQYALDLIARQEAKQAQQERAVELLFDPPVAHSVHDVPAKCVDEDLMVVSDLPSAWDQIEFVPSPFAPKDEDGIRTRLLLRQSQSDREFHFSADDFVARENDYEGHDRVGGLHGYDDEGQELTALAAG